MRRILTIALALTFCLAMSTATAASLYEQEGTDDDGVKLTSNDADGPGGIVEDAKEGSITNWIWQTGSSTWTGVWGGGDSGNWYTISESEEDGNLAIEADIEMYCKTWADNYVIYFHIGNIYDASADDLKATFTGGFQGNNGQYIGFFMGEKPVDFNTGRITGAMVGTVDGFGRDISEENFDLTIKCLWDTGPGSGVWTPPSTYGSGGGYTNVLWWLIGEGQPGTYNITWLVRLHPDADQADGNYYFDPTMVIAPVL